MPCKIRREDSAKESKTEFVMEFVNQGGPRISITAGAREVAEKMAQVTGFSINADSSYLNLVSEHSRVKSAPIFEVSAEEDRGIVVSFYGWNGLPKAMQEAISHEMETLKANWATQFKITGSVDGVLILGQNNQ
jgi:hypothetical protein